MLDDEGVKDAQSKQTDNTAGEYPVARRRGPAFYLLVSGPLPMVTFRICRIGRVLPRREAHVVSPSSIYPNQSRDAIKLFQYFDASPVEKSLDLCSSAMIVVGNPDVAAWVDACFGLRCIDA